MLLWFLLLQGVETQEKNNNYFPLDNNIPRTTDATTFFFPPQRLCKITINEDIILSSFNAYISTLSSFEQVEFFEEETGFLKTNDNKVLYNIPNQNTDTCSTCTDVVKLYSTNSVEIYSKLRLYFGKIGGSATVKIKTSTDNTPIGEDGKPILAYGKYDPEFPYVIFSADTLKYANSTHKPEACLCMKTRDKLSGDLLRVKDQLNLHHRALAAKEPTLKNLIINMFTRITNTTIYFKESGEAVLDQTPETNQDCFKIKLEPNFNLEPLHLPSRITPKSLNSAASILNDAVHRLNSFTNTLHEASELIKPSKSDYITTTTRKETIADVLSDLNTRNPATHLIIILISTLSLTILLLILTPTILIITTRRGLLNFVRNSTQPNQPTHLTNLMLERQNYPSLINNYVN